MRPHGSKPTSWTTGPHPWIQRDIPSCENNHGIEFISRSMKLREKAIGCRLRDTARVTKNQFGFTANISPTKVIFLLRRLMKIHSKRRIDVHMVLIDLEKTYDSVPK